METTNPAQTQQLPVVTLTSDDSENFRKRPHVSEKLGTRDSIRST